MQSFTIAACVIANVLAKQRSGHALALGRCTISAVRRLSRVACCLALRMRVAKKTGPAAGIYAEAATRSLKRCSLPVSVRGSAVQNSIARGYLYGAMWALTKSCSSRANASPAV